MGILLLQGIFPTQGSKPGLPHYRWVLLPAEPPEKHIVKLCLALTNIQSCKHRPAVKMQIMSVTPESSFELNQLIGKDLILGKIEGRRRGRQRMRWLYGIADSMDMSLSKL